MSAITFSLRCISSISPLPFRRGISNLCLCNKALIPVSQVELWFDEGHGVIAPIGFTGSPVNSASILVWLETNLLCGTSKLPPAACGEALALAGTYLLMSLLKFDGCMLDILFSPAAPSPPIRSRWTLFYSNPSQAKPKRTSLCSKCIFGNLIKWGISLRRERPGTYIPAFHNCV